MPLAQGKAVLADLPVGHGDLERLVIFKLDCGARAYTRELRASVGPRYRAGGRLTLVNFKADVAERAATRRVGEVPESWYDRIEV